MELSKFQDPSKSTLVLDELARRRLTMYNTMSHASIANMFGISKQCVRKNAERHNVALQIIQEQANEIQMLKIEMAAIKNAQAQNVGPVDCGKPPHKMTDDEFRKCIAIEMQSNRASDCIGKGENWQTSETLRV
jgi:predicted DNA-binding protein (UPF0251 family)